VQLRVGEGHPAHPLVLAGGDAHAAVADLENGIAEVRRQRKAEREERLAALGSGPREAIALALHECLDLLQKATVKALQDAASDEPALRRSGRQALPRLLDQALGRVEEAKGTLSAEDDPIASLKRAHCHDRGAAPAACRDR
jgi:hypothetical protein